MSIFSKILMIGLLAAGAAHAQDANCPADLPLKDVDFLNNDVKLIVVNAIPIEKFETEKSWEQTIGDTKVTARLSLAEEKTKKRVLLKDREIYAIRMEEYNSGSDYEATITFDDAAISNLTIEHKSITGGSVYSATIGSIERAFDGAINITCEAATVDPTIR